MIFFLTKKWMNLQEINLTLQILFSGRGVFARETIKKGSFIVHYNGELKRMSRNFYDNMDPRYAYDFVHNGTRFWYTFVLAIEILLF